MLVILKIKVSLVSIKKLLYLCRPSYVRRVSSHRVLYLWFLDSYNMCISYLHVVKTFFKVAIACFISAIRKIFQLLSKTFFIPSLCIFEFLKKIALLTNIKNKSLFFRRHFQMFVIYNMIADSVLVEKWGSIRLCKEVRQQKLVKFRLLG